MKTEYELIPDIVRIFGKSSHTTYKKLVRLSNLYRVFIDLKDGEVRYDFEGQWEELATAHGVSTSQIRLDLETMVDCGLLQSRHIGFNEASKRVFAYAITLPEILPKSILCPNCGAFLPIIYREFKAK